MSGPQVSIDLRRIEHNARAVVNRCSQSGIQVFGVTKGTCGMPHVARAMLRGGVVGIAESRFENIRRLRDSGIHCPIMLLRSPPVPRAEEVVRSVDISLQSELSIISEISRVAERLGRVHDIILMVDLGDLREGIWPSELLPTVEQVMAMRGVRIAGVGTNLTCFGAIVPTEENLNQLVANAYKVERRAGIRLDWVSGGNSSSLPLLLAGRMPQGVNNLRIGEAILQGGRDTFLEEPWEELDRDAFLLSGDLLEVKVKPSMPIGKSGVDAFGQRPQFVDEGDRLRGIANIGREDVIVEGLEAVHKGVRVLGASSDHLVLDLTDAQPPLKVGDRVGFRMNYGAMLTVMTSEYVEKAPLFEVEERPVPPSEVPGEEAWPTQPVPVKPPPFARQSMKPEELTEVTPESRAYCAKLIEGAVFGGLFTPIGLKPTVLFPGTNGGANWGGASFDPETRTLYVNSMDVGMLYRMVERPEGAEVPYRNVSSGTRNARFWDPNLYPCQKPPWGHLTAIDLDRGEFRWRSVLGVIDELVAKGLPPTGTSNLGGTIVTAGGLVFIGATNDSRFRAFDKETGKELWVTKLPASAHATPMTFLGRKSGKQYVVVAAGGGNKYTEGVSDTLVAFSLP